MLIYTALNWLTFYRDLLCQQIWKHTYILKSLLKYLYWMDFIGTSIDNNTHFINIYFYYEHFIKDTHENVCCLTGTKIALS